MGVGISIFLIAIGAIFAFAIHIAIGWLSLNVVGYVLMVAGFIGLVLTLWFWNNRRMPAGTPVPVERDRIVEDERRIEYHPPE